MSWPLDTLLETSCVLFVNVFVVNKVWCQNTQEKINSIAVFTLHWTTVKHLFDKLRRLIVVNNPMKITNTVVQDK